MSEILSREEFEAQTKFAEKYMHHDGPHTNLIATIEALAEALQIVDADDGFQLAKTSLDAMEPLREKGWIE